VTWRLAIFLGALQGCTEFLPISSSGHLVLVQHYSGFPEEAGAAALFFDGMVHLGTLAAVLVYFAGELVRFLREHGGGDDPPASRKALRGRLWADGRRLVLLVAVGTLPAAATTLVAREHIQDSFRQPVPVAVHFLLLGGILLLGDRLAWGKIGRQEMTLLQALGVGCGQALSALFRGLSRSGMTITAALLAGLERGWAVRFSFLLSLAANLGLGGLALVQALADPLRETWLTGTFLAQTLVGTVVSGVVGYLCIGPLIRLVRAARLWWFSAYLWLAGTAVLVWEAVR
jgi:undecaprenyl-diphosphatase